LGVSQLPFSYYNQVFHSSHKPPLPSVFKLQSGSVSNFPAATSVPLNCMFLNSVPSPRWLIRSPHPVLLRTFRRWWQLSPSSHRTNRARRYKVPLPVTWRVEYVEESCLTSESSPPYPAITLTPRDGSRCLSFTLFGTFRFSLVLVPHSGSDTMALHMKSDSLVSLDTPDF